MVKSILLVCIMLMTKIALAASPVVVDSDLTLEHFPAKNPIAQVIWLPSEYGVLAEEKRLAQQLSEQGFSVTMPDLFESYFLPAVPSSLNKIPLDPLKQIIEQSRNPLPLIVISSNQGAALAVKGLVASQQQPVNLLGLVLINPNLYVETPEVGQAAAYWPQTAQINFPIYVFQAELSPWRWQLGALQQQLAQSGSDVFVELLPQVRDRFYFRPDALNIEQQKAKGFASKLANAIHRLTPYLAEQRLAGRMIEEPESKTTRPGKKSVEIASYQGPQNRQLVLQDVSGKSHDLKDYRGQVILLNFWASWCPPCVHEMPSMARLKTQLKEQPFEILAANLAEDQAAIQAFTKEHPVNFPILLDPKGSAVKEWKVFAYPSSYLIDKQGQIRYALFGGYEWDNPKALQKVKQLLAE